MQASVGEVCREVEAMKSRCEEGGVPPGKFRRIGLIMEVCCGRCGDRQVVHAIDTPDTRSRLIRRLGWRFRRNAWLCPACGGGKPAENGLKLRR